MLAMLYKSQIIVLMNSLPSREPSQPPKHNHFAERQTTSEIEGKLIELQNQSDEIGLVVYGQLMRGNLKAAKEYGLDQMAKDAQELLRKGTTDVEEPFAFAARYIYDDIESDLKLVYPVDYLYYTAHITGILKKVKPVAVQHPRVNRNGPKGFRLCAEIEASQVMGWTSVNDATMKIYVPIGEIQFEPVPREQGLQECLEPNDRLT